MAEARQTEGAQTSDTVVAPTESIHIRRSSEFSNWEETAGFLGITLNFESMGHLHYTWFYDWEDMDNPYDELYYHRPRSIVNLSCLASNRGSGNAYLGLGTDIAIIDRILHRDDETWKERLFRATTKVPCGIIIEDCQGERALIKGVASWVMGLRQDKTETESIATVVTLNELGAASSGVAQLMIHMVAIQKSREGNPRLSVLGMASDPFQAYFARLNPDKTFDLSSPQVCLGAITGQYLCFIEGMLLNMLELEHFDPEEREKIVPPATKSFSIFGAELWNIGAPEEERPANNSDGRYDFDCINSAALLDARNHKEELLKEAINW